MPTATTSKAVQIHNPREGSRLQSPREKDDVTQSWKGMKAQREQMQSLLYSQEQLTRKIEQIRRRILGGTGGTDGGFDWMYPTHKELDPTLNYSTGKFAYISPLNTLVTAGMTDIISNATVISCEGLWLCVQAVPAAAAGKFNVPVFPHPSGAASIGGPVFAPGTTAPSGTPLIGDLDLMDTVTGKPVLYWEYWGQVAC